MASEDGASGFSGTAASAESSGATARVLDGDEVAGVLSGAFYSPSEPPRSSTRMKAAAEKPTHYKVICISMYTKDLERLDELVDELKSRGITKANRSALIRTALDQLDLDKVPRGM